ncbi:hypothetical protein [Paralcaligenes ureilyticus]|nr:hypothetical protein [Paralcaligenes ureilyticus]
MSAKQHWRGSSKNLLDDPVDGGWWQIMSAAGSGGAEYLSILGNIPKKIS